MVELCFYILKTILGVPVGGCQLQPVFIDEVAGGRIQGLVISVQYVVYRGVLACNTGRVKGDTATATAALSILFNSLVKLSETKNAHKTEVTNFFW